MSVRILHGDCREVLKTLGDCSVDAVVTDSPYHLTNKGGGPHGKGLGNAFSRAQAGATTGGFMGMKWDGGDVAFRPETWTEALRVLKPGGMLVAFGGTRTFHRLVCAIEDGGFEVRDMLAWLYGSGFPKGTDKAKIPEAWRGWNTALKPAIEPICLGRKPMDGTLAENLTKWGTGALWIDGCRVDHDPESAEWVDKYAGRDGYQQGAVPFGTIGKTTGGSPLGRWPANIIHDGSAEVLAAFPFATGGKAPITGNEPSSKTATVFGEFVGRSPGDWRDGGGSAARFFYCAKADRADRNAGLDGMPEWPLLWSSGEQNPGAFQSPNTKRAAQNNHPTVKPTDLMRYLCRLVTPPGGLVLDPFMGSGSTLKAAELEGFSAIGIELDADYIAIARRRIASDAPLFAEVTT